MTDRADEAARKTVRENTDDVEEYADLEFAIASALRAYAEEARQAEREASAKILDERAAQMAGKHLSCVRDGVESAEGTWYRARRVEAAEGAAAIRARGEKG